jgi:protein gp37
LRAQVYISFYFEQWGGPNKAKRGRLLDGQLWSQMPELNGAHPISKQMLLL